MMHIVTAVDKDGTITRMAIGCELPARLAWHRLHDMGFSKVEIGRGDVPHRNSDEMKRVYALTNIVFTADR